MADEFHDAEVPFVTIGNRRGFTAMQLQQEPWLMEFYKRFEHQFDTSPYADVVLLIEPNPLSKEKR